ncbi:hypothetical protein CPC08DRAFT_769995 [Agrocybe pediades]|nr:hypothetical protein CPC08DRAFT_769995 [Agrocybe pediades]
MAENLCTPMPQTVSTANSQHPGRDTSLRESNACNGDSISEHYIPGNMHCVVDIHAVNPSQPVAQAVQFPVVNVTDSPVNTSHEGSNIKILLYCLWTSICTKGMQALSAGFSPSSNWCYYLFYCTPDESVTEQSRREHLARWEKTLRSITRSWKDTQSITTSLLLVSALAILQLDDVLSNRAICTFMAAAILLALASVLSSFIYLLSKEKFISRWKTLEAPNPAFWKCVAMPLDFAIWWAHSRFPKQATAHSTVPEQQRMLPTQADATIDVECTISPPEPLGAAVVAILTIIAGCKIYYGLCFFYARNRQKHDVNLVFPAA